MAARDTPERPASEAIDEEELEILDRVEQRDPASPPRTLRECVRSIARLGGYLARKNDGPPGNTVVWRGLSRLADIRLGIELARLNYG